MIKEVTFGAGCFWCIEACFNEVNGIKTVAPGYMGGDSSTANYNAVCSGRTNHAEVALIIFDDEVISFEKLLELFWFVHDPTQLNRQGNDVGRHYRSAIFYHESSQKELAIDYIEKLTKMKVWNRPIVTEITPTSIFYPAEDYHKDYLKNNLNNPYCQSMVRPKVESFKKVFGSLIR